MTGETETDVIETPEIEALPEQHEPPSRDQLETNVGIGLRKLFGEEDLIDGAPDSVEETAAGDTTAEVTEEGQDAPEAATDTEAALEQEAAEIDATVGQPPAPKAPTAVPTLPAAYVRSLKALEWTDAEIAEAAKQPGFLPVAAKLHATRNKELQGWAELGRKQREQATQTPAKDATSQPAAMVGLKPLDPAALKAEYGDDKLIDAVLGPVNKAIEQINAMLPIVQQTQKASETAQLEMMSTQIDSFFSEAAMKPFHQVYGTGSKVLTDKQGEAREPILEMAGALIAGARVQGRTLTLRDALQAAFDSVSSEHKEQAVRSEIKQQLKTRRQGLTLRPSSRGTVPVAGKVNSREALERKVQMGMRSVFQNS